MGGLSRRSSPIAKYALGLRNWNSRSFSFLAFCYHAHRIHRRSAVQRRHQTSALAKPLRSSHHAQRASRGFANAETGTYFRSSHHAQRARPSRNQCPSCNPLCRLAHVVRLQKRLNCWAVVPRSRCASLSAFESGIFELLGQLYPARFFFGQAKKKSPKASEATNEALGPNALNQQATHLLRLC